MAPGNPEPRRPHPWGWLILLTLVAGCLRFYSLDKPSIWGDESATWRRVSGTYQQMLDELRTAGFMPGHYLLTWWIKDGFPVWGHYESASPSLEPDIGGRLFRRLIEPNDPSNHTRAVWTPTVRLVPGGIAPTPMMLRFVPALCGTLMVPAMYLLASRLVARRTALLAALFTACSAWMLNYSRDAKMYAQFWFCATLHVGCLLWWLEAYRRPRSDDLEVTTRRRWSKQDELGEGVAGVLPAHHVGDVARAFVGHAGAAPIVLPRVSRLSTLVRFACWLTAGLAMIAFSAVGLAVVVIELLIVLATIPQRVGWIAPIGRRIFFRRNSTIGPGHFSAPVSAYRHARPSLLSRLHLPPLLSFLAGATCILLLFSGYRQFTRFYDRVEPTSVSSTQIDIDDAGISWVEPYNRGRTPESHFLENATAYLFNWEWVKPREMQYVQPELLSRLRWSAMLLLTAIALGLIPWRAIIDRLIGMRRERGPMPATSLFILAMWLFVPAYGIYAASGAWNDAGQKIRAEAPLSTIIGAAFPGATPGNVEPLRGVIATTLKPVISGVAPWPAAREKLASLPWSELFVVHGLGDASPRWWVIVGLLLMVVVAALSWQRPWLLVATVAERSVGTLEAEIEDARAIRSLRRRRAAAWWSSLLLRGLAESLAIVLLVALLLLAFVVVPPQQSSIWMPRYLGFVWPAFAIIVCVLIRRLPLLPVRWAVIAGLLAVNLANYSMRLQHGEPPTAQIARDEITAAQHPNARVFAPVVGRHQFGGPGTGGAFSMPAAYYYLTLSKTPVTPREAFGYINSNKLAMRFGGNYATAIRSRMLRDPTADDIYVWAELPITTPPNEPEVTLLAALGPTWKPVEPSKRWMIYDHWTWQQLNVLDRVHLQRVPATQPTTRVAPRPVLRPAPASKVSIRPATRPTTQANTWTTRLSVTSRAGTQP